MLPLTSAGHKDGSKVRFGTWRQHSVLSLLCAPLKPCSQLPQTALACNAPDCAVSSAQRQAKQQCPKESLVACSRVRVEQQWCPGAASTSRAMAGGT